MPAAACSLRLLGTPQLHCGGTALLLEPQRSHQLLAYLALRADWVRREQLAALFWPERGEAAARSNLRKVILMAHQTLHDAGATPVEDRDGALRWRVDTDVAAFAQAAERGQFVEAVGRYAGPLLRGLESPASAPFADWLQFERTRLAQRWRDCVFSAARETADPSVRAEWAARLLARDPLDEAAVRLQLAALVAAGRPADALQAYRTYASNLAQETGLEPPAEIRALCAADAPHRASGAPLASAGAFFGRSAELRAIQSVLRPQHAPVLAIVGPGGIGKSRLLAEAVRQAAPQFEHGAVVVGLHGVQDAGTLATRIARALGLELPAAGDAGAALCAQLRSRSLLLGLDGFEHLRSAAPLIERLQADCAGVRMALTSRVRPGVAAEHVIAIGGLACPGEGDTDVEGFDAVRLFAHHARRASPGFDVTTQAADVAAICRLVDGLPLALELAAGWVRLFRCADIAADLRRSLDLLRGGGDDNASVTAILEQTWSLLVPQERQLLSLLAVFRGGFDAEAVRAVADLSLAVVAALVDKSLVRSEAHGRMSLHPLVHHFAERRLRAGDGGCTESQARQRHAEHYARLLGALAPPVPPDKRVPAIRIDFDNVCAMWGFALSTRQPALVERAARSWSVFLEREGRYEDAVAMLSAGDELLRQSDPPRPVTRATLLVRRASLHYRVGDLAGAEADARRILQLVQGTDDAVERRRALNVLGVVHWARGQHDRAQAAFEELLADLRTQRDDRDLEANVVGNLGLIAFGAGRFDEAHRLYAESLVLHRQVGSRIGEVQQLLNLGSVCLAQRQWREVVRLMGEGLALARTIDYNTDRPYGLHAMAQAHLQLGDLRAARSCCESALELIDQGAERLQRPIVLAVLCEIELAEGRLDAAGDTVRAAALAAHQGALAHDQISVIQAWASLLLAQQRMAEATILWSMLATHRSTLADQRDIIRAGLARARERLPQEVFAACERKAATLQLEPLLTQAASLLAPTP